jgi:L-lactate dehydrogenase (cytochrome)
VNIADLRMLARRRLPRLVFDYIDGGAEDEFTLRDNSRAFDDIRFRPRQCIAVPECDLRTTVLGTTLDLPFLLAPIGFSRMFYPRGEAVAARSASVAGTAYVLSTFSGTRLEEVREHASGPLWYQLYVPGGRAVAEAAIARARAAGYSALVVTIDTPVSGMRERDYRNGVRPLLAGDWRGSDIVKALCLGARAVLVGRAYAWALGAAGGSGVDRAIAILRTDIDRTLHLLGCSSVAQLDASYIER